MEAMGLEKWWMPYLGIVAFGAFVIGALIYLINWLWEKLEHHFRAGGRNGPAIEMTRIPRIVVNNAQASGSAEPEVNTDEPAEVAIEELDDESLGMDFLQVPAQDYTLAAHSTFEDAFLDFGFV